MSLPKQNSQSENIINDSTAVNNILRLIQKHRKIITITPDGSKDHYLSGILDIEKNQNYIVIDELKPYAGHHELINSDSYMAESRVDNFLIKFESKLINIEEYGDYCEYHCSHPKEIVQIEQRSEIRHCVKENIHIAVELQIQGKWEKAGNLKNLSKNGIYIILNENIPIGPHSTKSGLLCKIKLYSNVEFMGMLELRHRYIEPGSQCTYAGFRFIHRSAEQISALEALISQIRKDKNFKK